jgi:hypothetical protein
MAAQLHVLMVVATDVPLLFTLILDTLHGSSQHGKAKCVFKPVLMEEIDRSGFYIVAS